MLSEQLWKGQSNTLSDAWNGKKYAQINIAKKFLKSMVLGVTGGIWTKWRMTLIYLTLK